MRNFIFIMLFSATAFGQVDVQSIANMTTEQASYEVDLDVMEQVGLEGIDVVGGYGERTDNYRFAADWSFYQTHLANGRWIFKGTMSVNFSKFQGERDEDGLDVDIRDFGITPVWTLIPSRFEGKSYQPFIEAGIGFHHLSRKDLPTKSFSTNFQFGDHLGLGVRFGKGYRFKAAYQFQHLSNGGIDAPNPGINFHLVSMGVRLK